MITFNQTFEESRAIRVLVVPIGDNCMYDKHFETVSRRRSLPIFDLNKPSDWKSHNSPFKNFNWQSSGNIQFDYCRYDRVAHGPSDLDNFQASRRVLVIIGVINYPELDASVSSKLETEMDYYSRRYPNIILRRYFVFNYFEAKEGSPLLELTAKTTALDPYAMVIFPPDRECEGGSMIDVHTHEIMSNVAVKLFAALEFHILKCEEYRGKAANVVSSYKSNPHVTTASLLPSWLTLSTHYDMLENTDLDSTTSSSSTLSLAASSSVQADKVRKAKKRINGRMRKWMGDVCLQVCSPIDALEHFSTALSECRSQHDYMWLASALEGTVVAMLMVLEQETRTGGIQRATGSAENSGEVESGRIVQSSDLLDQLPLQIKELKSLISGGFSISNAVLRLAESRCLDAMDHYSKFIALCGLEVECALKCARMHEAYNIDLISSGTTSNGSKDVAGGRREKAMEFILRAVAVPGLNVQQQIECTLEGAFACYRMGMKRKYAFLLYVAATLSSNAENTEVAYALVKKACQQYGVTESSDTEQKTESNMVVNSPNCSWSAMRRVLFAHCAHFATENGDKIAAAQCLTTLLRLVGEMETNKANYKRMWTADDKELVGKKTSQHTSPMTSHAPHLSPARIRPDTSHDSFSLLEHSPLRDSFSPSSLSNSPLTRMTSRHSLSMSMSTVGDSVRLRSRSSIGRSVSSASVQLDDTKDDVESVHNSPEKEILQATRTMTETTEYSQSSTGEDGEGDDDEEEDEDDAVSVVAADDNKSDVKDARGLIAIPKIAPFVQNLVSIGGNLKRKHRSKDREDLSTGGGSVGGGSQRISTTFDHSVSSAAGFITNIKSHVLPREGPKNAISPSLESNGVSGMRQGPTQVTLQRNVTNSSSSSSLSSSSSAVKRPSSMTTQQSAGTESTTESGSTSSVSAKRRQPPPLARPSSKTEDATARLGVPAEVQRHLVKVFSSLCCGVPPATPLLLEGLPFLLFLKPVPLQNDLLPVKIDYYLNSKSEGNLDVRNTANASALFYDPFEAKRRKAEGLTSILEINWSVNTLCYVDARFANPLAVPIVLHDVHVIFDESETETAASSYDLCSLVIPPHTQDYSVTLTVRPRHVGPLKLKGVQYSLFNGLHTAFVDTNTGKGIVNLNKELSAPTEYPRKLVQQSLKSPPRYQSNNVISTTSGTGGKEKDSSGNIVANEAEDKALKEKAILKEKETSSELERRYSIQVAPESATLRLSASWCIPGNTPLSNFDITEGSPFGRHISEAPSDLANSLGNAFSLELLEGERRVESIVLSNISEHLKIEDIRISVRFSAGGNEMIHTKQNCVFLLPFAHLITDQNDVVVLDTVHSPLKVEIIRRNTDDDISLLPLLPLSSTTIDLAFSFCHDQSSSFFVDLQVEYITEFEGWADIVSQSLIEDVGEMEPSHDKKEAYIRKTTVSSVVSLSPALRISAVVPLTASNVDSVAISAVGDGPGGSVTAYNRRSRAEEVAGSRGLILETLRQEVAAIARVSKKENDRNIGVGIDVADSSASLSLLKGTEGQDAKATVSCDDITLLCSRRLFSVELCNGCSSPMRISWSGEGSIFNFHSSKQMPNGDSSHLNLSALSSINVLISIDDDQLCRLLGEAHELASEYNRSNDSVRHVSSTAFDDETLLSVYTNLFKELKFAWSVVNIDEKCSNVSNGRSGIVKFHPREMLNAAKQSAKTWKHLLPRPFDIAICVGKVSPGRTGKSSNQCTQVDARKPYNLSILIDLQVDMINYFKEVFTHVEVMIIILNDTMIQKQCMYGSSSISGMSSYDSEQPFSTLSSLSQNRVAIQGRTRVKLPLEGLTGSHLLHSVSICCTRNGNYFVHPLVRFVGQSQGHHSSSWWTLQDPFTCSAK